MLIILSILLITLLISALVLVLLNYKESNKTLFLLNQQDIVILQMKELNEKFLHDLN